jgi:3-methyladenine DNA glycosylase/8-oxoguanine DNA glycosylase
MPDIQELTHCFSLILTPCAPFHFDATVYKPSYFPGSDLVYNPGRIWHSMRFEGVVYGILMENLGSIDAPSMRLEIYSAAPLGAQLAGRISAEIGCRYDLYSDLSEFYNAGGDDPLLAPVLERWRGVHPSTYSNLYEYLVISTLLQNATIRRTVQMAENLFTRFGSRVAFAGQELSAYWEPAAIDSASEEELRALKMGYRAKTLKRQAANFTAGDFDEASLRLLPTPELKKSLLNIYGVGQASVWYLLFGQFKRYEVFEYISPWEQKIYSRLLFDQELVDAKTILAEVELRWGAWKMLAAHLLFEDLFWQHRTQPVPWLESLIRL